MPTVLRVGAYRFFFYAGDRDEPPHIHVERGDNTAKYWLDPVMFQDSHGFSRSEIRQVERLIEEHLESLMRGWHEYFA